MAEATLFNLEPSKCSGEKWGSLLIGRLLHRAEFPVSPYLDALKRTHSKAAPENLDLQHKVKNKAHKQNSDSKQRKTHAAGTEGTFAAWLPRHNGCFQSCSICFVFRLRGCDYQHQSKTSVHQLLAGRLPASVSPPATCPNPAMQTEQPPPWKYDTQDISRHFRTL